MRKVPAGLVLAIAACSSAPAPQPPVQPAQPPVAEPPEDPPPVVVQPPAAPVEPAVAIPETPAGKTLGAWLEAFNSNDEARAKAFIDSHKFRDSVREMIEFRAHTGGFELRGIGANSPLEIAFTVKEKSGPVTAIGRFKLVDPATGAEPTEIAEFSLRAIPPNMTAADMDITVDAAMRAWILDGTDKQLTEFYIYPPIAKKMIKAMRDHDKAGDYTALTSGAELARKLTHDLAAISHDGHLRVEFRPTVVRDGDLGEPTADEKARMREELEREHCGFTDVKKLAGNIGYIELDGFAPVDICGPEATKAFAAIEGVDAVIIDLRGNGGGEPDMVSFVASYLFAKRTHLNDLYDRRHNKTTQYWTKPDVPGTKLATQPAYVLTSHRTFSGAEEFSYDLQTQKRATIVGETTGGGAHPTEGKRIDDHFVISVPFARPINPVTKKDWEGTGVLPDVKVSADDALDTATRLAAEAIAKAAKVRK